MQNWRVKIVVSEYKSEGTEIYSSNYQNVIFVKYNEKLKLRTES